MAAAKQAHFISRVTSQGQKIRIPVGTILGEKAGPQITIYAGEHGTEYEGIEAAQRLFREVDPSNVSGKIVICPVANEESLLKSDQFSTLRPKVVEMMVEIATDSQYLINCHGGEFSEKMCPYVICRILGHEGLDKKAIRMAEVFGLPFIAFARYQGEPPPSASGERHAWWLWPAKDIGDILGIPQLIVESGQGGSRDEDSLTYRGLVNVLRHLGILAGEPRISNKKPQIIRERHWVSASAEGLFFPEVDICQDVRSGQRLGLVRDYFGKVLEEVISPADAKVMNMNWGMPVTKNGFLLWLGEM